MLELHDGAEEALDFAGVDGPVDFVGHSMAGLVTLAYAIERPARVKRLVLIGTGSGRIYMNAPGALWHTGHPRFGAMARLAILHEIWPARGPERMLNNLIHAASFVDPRQADLSPVSLADWFRPREGWTGWHWQARKLDYSQRLVEIAVPTLVLCGRRDPQYPLACSMQLAEHIPYAQLMIFDRSGHFPYVEERDAFEHALAAFFETATTPEQVAPARGSS